MAKRTRSPKHPAIPAGKPEQARAKAAGIEAQAQAAKLARAEACMAEINAVLRKHNCALVAIQQYVNGQPGPLQFGCSAQDAPAAAGAPGA